MKIPWKYILIILAAIYVISPIDVLPDLIPGVGRIDDLGFIIGLLYYLWTGKVPFQKFFRAMFRPHPQPDTGYSQQQQQQGQTRTESSQNRSTDPYEILGLKPGASQDEIHRAYRELSQKYHPDKVSHLGEEFQELARQRFVEIQAAYDKIHHKNGK